MWVIEVETKEVMVVVELVMAEPMVMAVTRAIPLQVLQTTNV